MSIAKLSLLADAFASLQSLILTGTMWSVEPYHFGGPSGGASVVEAQLIHALRRLPAFRKVNLGLFRVLEHKQPFARFEEYCKSRTPESQLSWRGIVEELL